MYILVENTGLNSLNKCLILRILIDPIETFQWCGSKLFSELLSQGVR